ncbi:MAG: DUF5319 domain-containing protein [Actinomycetota bacterium]|nr:DUF5319 domain-containing protein [Actinomycetota bacterium]
MSDPTGSFDDEPEQEITEEEREALRQDLVDVQVLKEVLGPKGLKGTVFYCPDCDEDHYLAWDLLAGNLKEMLEQGESPVHEPAFEPDPDEYVSWDYARGFLDGYESFEREDMSETAAGLVLALRDRGWPPNEVKGLLVELGIDVNFPPADGH